MTDATDVVSNWLTGAVRFKDGVITELAVYCLDPVGPELEAIGYLEQDFIATAAKVIDDIKGGAKFSASFRGAPQLYLVEIVTRNGRETLEVADVGQPAQFKTLRNLPLPGGE